MISGGKMNKKKKIIGFTIAEALVSFTLMGIIFVASISNIRRNENYHKLYWQAFNTLYQASKSIHEEWEGANSSCSCSTSKSSLNNCYKASCWRNSNVVNCTGCERQEREFPGGTTNIDRDFPGFLYNNSIYDALSARGQDKAFCEKFVEKINTLPTGRCASFISVADPKVVTNNSSNGGKNFFKAFTFAELQDDGTYKRNDMEGISPSFTALNGQQFYISSVVSANTSKELGSTWIDFLHTSRESYRFVVVDLNGNSPPNSQFVTGTKNPDLVLFAINSMGEVIPLGLPEFSKTYINAVVYYPKDLNSDGSPMYPKQKSDPMTLWDAKAHAFGNESGSAIQPYSRAISSTEPLSQSSKFYATALWCQGKASTCNNRNVKADGVYADDLFVNLVLQFLFKSENSTEIYPYLTNSAKVVLSTKNGCSLITRDDPNNAPTCAIDFEH